MKISTLVGVRERCTSDLTTRQVMRCFFALCLIAQCLSFAFASEIEPYFDPARDSTTGTVSRFSACKITVLQAHFWRDWMPIVGRPGPDRGSPLRAKVRLSLDNSTGGMDKLSFRAIVVDDQGQSYPVTFHVLPNCRVLPDAASKSYRNLDAQAKRPLAAKDNVTWNGEIRPGEVMEIELVTAEGPYLPVGSSVHVEITWTYKKGESVVVKSPAAPIQRTD